jgi:hypothetical protein
MKLIGLLACALIVIAVASLGVGWWCSLPKQSERHEKSESDEWLAKQPADVQRFHRLAEMIKVGMTKDQVDETLRDYPASDPARSDDMGRPKKFSKWYYLTLDGAAHHADGDYTIIVDFDKYGVVVDSFIGQPNT